MKKNVISLPQVKHVAALSGLNLTHREVKKFQIQLAEILVYFKRLQAIKTEKVPPTNQVTGLKNILRPDKKGACLNQKSALANTRRQEAGAFVIPSVKEQWH